MRTKKILLLSCLLPIFLLFVIGYTNAYTVQKVTGIVSASSQPVKSVTFTFAKPVPITIPENALIIEEPIASSSAPIASVSPIASESATKASLASSPSVTPTIVPTKSTPRNIAITPVPTIIEALRESAVIVGANGSSAIIPSASSVIIESNVRVDQIQQQAPQYQPRFCTDNDFC